jgi:hypothetical protein
MINLFSYFLHFVQLLPVRCHNENICAIQLAKFTWTLMKNTNINLSNYKRTYPLFNKKAYNTILV